MTLLERCSALGIRIEPFKLQGYAVYRVKCSACFIEGERRGLPRGSNYSLKEVRKAINDHARWHLENPNQVRDYISNPGRVLDDISSAGPDSFGGEDFPSDPVVEARMIEDQRRWREKAAEPARVQNPIFIYLCGPYTLDPEAYVKLAKQEAAVLIADGYIVFTPHLSHYIHQDHPQPYETWMRQDFAWLEKCDAVYRFSTGFSPGADQEVYLAKKMGKPVFYGRNALRAWKSP